MQGNQEVRGDNRPINDKGSSKEGEFDKSLGDASRNDLEMGYTGMGKMTSSTKSDGKDGD